MKQIIEEIETWLKENTKACVSKINESKKSKSTYLMLGDFKVNDRNIEIRISNHKMPLVFEIDLDKGFTKKNKKCLLELYVKHNKEELDMQKRTIGNLILETYLKSPTKALMLARAIDDGIDNVPLHVSDVENKLEEIAKIFGLKVERLEKELKELQKTKKMLESNLRTEAKNGDNKKINKAIRDLIRNI